MRLKEAQVYHKSRSKTGKAANSSVKHGGSGLKAKGGITSHQSASTVVLSTEGSLSVLHKKVKVNSRDEHRNWKNGIEVLTVNRKISSKHQRG
jgi:hypothetical protein